MVCFQLFFRFSVYIPVKKSVKAASRNSSCRAIIISLTGLVMTYKRQAIRLLQPTTYINNPLCGAVAGLTGSRWDICRSSQALNAQAGLTIAPGKRSSWWRDICHCLSVGRWIALRLSYTLQLPCLRRRSISGTVTRAHIGNREWVSHSVHPYIPWFRFKGVFWLGPIHFLP